MHDIPWRGIISMRNRLVHAYFTINLDLVWAGVTDDLPLLLNEVRRVLDENPEDASGA